LIITVLIPYLRAVEMIEERLPPFDCETYQIHIPRVLSTFAAPPVRAGGAVVPPLDPAGTPPDAALAIPSEDAQPAATIATAARRVLRRLRIRASRRASLSAITCATVAENPRSPYKLRCKPARAGR
jgi:hypothetical protein